MWTGAAPAWCYLPGAIKTVVFDPETRAAADTTGDRDLPEQPGGQEDPGHCCGLLPGHGGGDQWVGKSGGEPGGVPGGGFI